MTTSEYIMVFNEYRMYIFYLCKKFLDNQEDAEDITVDVFMKLWGNKEKVNLESAKAWLSISAKNKALDLLKSKALHQSKLKLINIDPSYEINTEVFVLNKIIKIINQLPRQQRAVMKLRFIEDKTLKEIAEELNIHIQTVANHLDRAVKASRLKIKNSGINHG